jgi:hypothetical protein
MVEDDGKIMVCRAENPVVSGLFEESTWKISVVCEYTQLAFIAFSLRRQTRSSIYCVFSAISARSLAGELHGAFNVPLNKK